MKPERNRLIQLIHVARRDLALDEETYRAALESTTGKTSAAEMSLPELNKVVSHLKSKGFKVRHTKQSRPVDQSPAARKIRSLWLSLHELGAVKNPSEAALGAYVKRIAGVDALQWLFGDQQRRVIETLKMWIHRMERSHERDAPPSR